MSTKSSERKSSVSIAENTNGQETFATQLFRRPSKSKTDPEITPSKEQLTRRRSTFKGLATSIRSIVNMRFLVSGRYNSLSLTQPAKPFVKMENTYKIDPDNGKSMNSEQLYRVISETLEKRLKNEKYDPKSCGTLTCDLSTLIKQKVKQIEKPRYKYVCQVIAGQRCDQGIQVGSRCIWMPKTDTYQQVAYSNNNLFVVVTVFAVYFE